MSSRDLYAPYGHATVCAECTNDIETMAYRGMGVCGQKCLAAWRKKHPLPPALQVTFEEFSGALEHDLSRKDAKKVWDILQGNA